MRGCGRPRSSGRSWRYWTTSRTEAIGAGLPPKLTRHVDVVGEASLGVPDVAARTLTLQRGIADQAAASQDITDRLAGLPAGITELAELTRRAR